MNIVHVIPTFNEAENIGRMIDELLSIGKKYPQWRYEILVVDDHSPDGTSKVVQQYQKKFKNIQLLLKKKEGLGSALIMGYSYAIDKMRADIIIPNDADFQWNPQDYPRLMKKIEEGYDVVVASRHIEGGKVIGWNWFRHLNHSVSNSLLAWGLAGVHEVHDHAGNFKAIRVKNVLDKVPLEKMRNAGFSFQLHILYELSKTNARFTEIPVTFCERRFGKSKIGFNKYYLRDIVEYIRSSILIRLDRKKNFIKYLIVGGTGFSLQTIISKLFIQFSISPSIAVAIGAEGAIISNFLINNSWTFKHKKIQGLRLFRKFFQFNVASAGAILIQSVTVGLGTHFTGASTWFWWMVFGIIVMVIPYSFYVYNRLIWKTHL